MQLTPPLTNLHQDPHPPPSPFPRVSPLQNPQNPPASKQTYPAPHRHQGPSSTHLIHSHPQPPPPPHISPSELQTFKHVRMPSLARPRTVRNAQSASASPAAKGGPMGRGWVCNVVIPSCRLSCYLSTAVCCTIHQLSVVRYGIVPLFHPPNPRTPDRIPRNSSLPHGREGASSFPSHKLSEPPTTTHHSSRARLLATQRNKPRAPEPESLERLPNLNLKSPCMVGRGPCVVPSAVIPRS